MSTPFTTPVGRLVQGSLYTPNTTDAEGRALVVKSGPNIGQPRVEYFVALAIPKVPGQHWASSEWGAKLWAEGHKFLPHAGQMPTFAWKVRDGDSTVPNKKLKKPCDQEGFPGNWIVSFSSGFAPKTYTHVNVPAPVEVGQKDAINLGDYVQIFANVDGNGSQSQPGIFINLNMVCLMGYGQRIVIGPDVASAGFGGVALPAGASLTPPTMAAPMPAAPGAPVPPLVPNGSVAMPAPPAMVALAPLVPVTSLPPVVPNPAILALPPGVGAPPPPVATVAAPPAAPVRTMLPAAGGVSYEDHIRAGWNDAQLIQTGRMAA